VATTQQKKMSRHLGVGGRAAQLETTLNRLEDPSGMLGTRGPPGAPRIGKVQTMCEMCLSDFEASGGTAFVREIRQARASKFSRKAIKQAAVSNGFNL
jgi:hypothetical protein